MDQNPFQNPFTRNRVFSGVTFVSPDKAKDLKVPEAKSSWKEMQEYYDSLHVPQSENPIDRIGAFSVGIAKDGSRVINVSSPGGQWGDPWGRDEFAKEQHQDKISREFAQRSKIENAKLSAELEKDDFRKQLLADIDSGKMFALTRLEEVDESKKSTTLTKQQIKENKNGSNSDKQDIH